MPSDVFPPLLTALSAYSICSSFPDGLKVVRLNEYAESAMVDCAVVTEGGKEIKVWVNRGDGGLCRAQVAKVGVSLETEKQAVQ